MNQHGNNDRWPEDQVAELKSLWSRGKSAGEIAKILKGRTRNSIISKVYRLGLTGRGAPSQLVRRAPSAPTTARKAVRTAPRPGPRNKPAAVFGKVQMVDAEKTEALRSQQREQGQKLIDGFKVTPANDTAVRLMARRPFQCAWPVGEPETASDQMCCGAPVDPSATAVTRNYCAQHRQRASGGIPKTIKVSREYSPAGQRRAVPRSVWDEGRAA